MTTLDSTAVVADVITSSGRQQLQTRLEHETIAMIRLAEHLGREGLDPSELSDYARLLVAVDELRSVLSSAVPPRDLDIDDESVVHVGDEVEVSFDDGSTERFALVHPIEASPDDLRLSVRSPLGSAVAGARIGDRVRVDTPTGPYTARVRSRRRAP